MIGQKLGAYEIVAKLGEGGMGQVYRARDVRLDRTIALKVLSPAVAGEPLFRERFDREARAISALDHPNVCAVYDIGEENGIAFIVMQYLDGETLAARIQRSALPVAAAVRIGIEIAAALDAAHERGIVHRDLKPANVMLTSHGAKLLDFGLAKPAPAVVSTTAGTTLAAMPAPFTAEGTILGTFHYMAPEQLERGLVDARTDIFAFGAVMFEMMTGRRAFDGQSQASVIASLLEHSPPDVSSLQPHVPAAVDHVVRRALAKSPDDRWQTVRDLLAELKWIQSSAPAAPISGPGAPRRWLLAALAGALATTLVAAPVLWRATRRSDVIAVRLPIALPAAAAYGQWAPSTAISPDGRSIVFTAVHNGEQTLWLQRIDRLGAEPIRGSTGARGPFFSPDGNHVAFFADGKLQRVALDGSLPVAICDAPDVRGASWGDGDMIVFAPSTSSGLQRVAATGGAPQTVTTRDESKRERTHRFPDVLPGGGAMVYMIGTNDIASYADARIVVQALRDGSAPKVLVEGGASPRVAAGHLFYTRGFALMAAPLDDQRLELTGPEIRIAGDVAFRSSFGVSEYDVADDGSVVYLPGGETEPPTRLILIDRAGRSSVLDDTTTAVLGLTTSPDLQQLLLWRQGANDTMWVRDLRRGTTTPLTRVGAAAGGDWTADGARVIISLADRLASIPVDGSGVAETLYDNDALVLFPAVSRPDGVVFFTAPRPGRGFDILQFSPQTRTAVPWAESPANEGGPRPSPDGELIAYTSDETGRLNVFLRPRRGGGRLAVSSAGGTAPVWSRDGRELFFLNGGDLYVVAVQRQPQLALAPPRRLFPARAAVTPIFPTPWPYDVVADGKFVLIETLPVPQPHELRFVQRAATR